MNSDLSDIQKKILNFIMDEIEQKGYPPSVREIGRAVGLKSSSTVHNHLIKLEKKGYLRRDPSKPRAIEVLMKGSNKTEKSNNKFDLNIVNVPIVGKITAGDPIFADENIEEYFTLPNYFLGHNENVFMLRVKGSSMIEAGILDGDIIIVRKQNYADNGDIVVALIENEATVKRFYKEKDFIRLQPENRYMEPIFLKKVMILGKVIGLVRRY